jgi:hypothetical protein
MVPKPPLATHVRIESAEHASELLSDAETRFFNMLETCALYYPDSIRPGWLLEHEVSLSHLVIQHDIPQM